MKGKLEKYIKMQNKLSGRIIDRDHFEHNSVRHVAGVDVTFMGELAIARSVLLTYPDLELIDGSLEVSRIDFPYIPTFLMFREGKPAVRALRKILKPHTVIFVDGSGLCHPRRFGLACYVGLSLSAPTIGITKKPLTGKFEMPESAGDSRDIVLDEDIVGRAVKTCRRCNPIFVSVGHKISLDTALKLTLSTIRKGKLPEPIRLAHGFLQELRKDRSRLQKLMTQEI